MSAEALRLALAALEDSRPLASEDDFALKVCAHNEAIKACRAALAAADASKSVQKRLAVQTAQPVPLTTAEIDAVICAAYAFVAKRGAGNREHAIARFTEQAHEIGGKA